MGSFRKTFLKWHFFVGAMLDLGGGIIFVWSLGMFGATIISQKFDKKQGAGEAMKVVKLEAG